MRILRRLGIHICLAALLGFFASVLVSWLAVVVANYRVNPIPTFLMRDESTIEEGYLVWQSVGTTFVYFAPYLYGPEYQARSAELSTSTPPDWSELAHRRETITSQKLTLRNLEFEQAAGWPYRCLRWYRESLRIHGAIVVSRGLHQLPNPAAPESWPKMMGMPARVVLPLIPIGSGLAWNTLLLAIPSYGASVLSLRTIGLFLRRRRVKRQRCPNCSYATGGSSQLTEVCTECGCDLSRWKTWRYLLFGEIPLSPGADVNLKTKPRAGAYKRHKKSEDESTAAS